MKEHELFNPVKSFLIENMGCEEVFGEVLDCDVLGLNGSVNIIVELKTNLTFKLIDQAIERLKHGHYVYIAVPKRKTHIPRIVKKILEQHKIGLLYVNNGIVEISWKAKFNRLPIEIEMRYKKEWSKPYNIRQYIEPYHREQIGGKKSGEVTTEYSLMIDEIKRFLKMKRMYTTNNDGWVTIDDILTHCDERIMYSNPKPALSATLRKEWNHSWCEVKKIGRTPYFRYKERDV
ncbi:hypothetical protein [Bacillus safensis]|uniref:hypothetical protein n=1 Tax=Bacillus safensis TaxID=561879 RepID=UPI002E23AF9A|nr:hypothetical protein [Bacillus safensis]